MQVGSSLKKLASQELLKSKERQGFPFSFHFLFLNKEGDSGIQATVLKSSFSLRLTISLLLGDLVGKYHSAPDSPDRDTSHRVQEKGKRVVRSWCHLTVQCIIGVNRKPASKVLGKNKAWKRGDRDTEGHNQPSASLQEIECPTYGPAAPIPQDNSPPPTNNCASPRSAVTIATPTAFVGTQAQQKPPESSKDETGK